MKFVNISMSCTTCAHTNVRGVFKSPPGGFTGSILKTIWCDKCGNPIAVRYKVEGEKAIITESLTTSEVLVPRKPETGITIRPRASKHRHNN